MSDKIRNISTLFKGILLGGMIGAAITLLSAPQTGDETRDEVLEGTADIRAKAKQMADQTRQRATEIKQKGELLYADQKSKVESLVAGVSQGVRALSEPSQIPATGHRDLEMMVEAQTMKHTPTEFDLLGEDDTENDEDVIV